jgi:D-glycerate 3-kinase
MINEFIKEHKLSSVFSKVADDYFIPLAKEINLHHRSAKTPYYVGINGSQGSGKSTLSEFLKAYLSKTYKLNVIVMSLDDFYFSQVERQILAADIHPLFKTRGVPGTHNMSQVKSVLHALKRHQSTIIPRFNKATDNPHEQSAWTTINTPADIVIFEGWCWGIDAQDSSQLTLPVNAMEAEHDAELLWRNHVNMQLALHYQPLYALMNKWVMLKAPSFNDVYNWRLEQEQKLVAATATQDQSGIMNEQQVLQFIQYYQRLTEHGLNTLGQKCDHVFELNSARQITTHKTKEIHA